ncbi:MAG: hypothetical protein MJZ74_05940 [Muribaculaceae bacterium]|nr:hypothetical protein [Muribaculaceae bacterium]
MEALVKEVREFVISRWRLGELHGYRHWDRVYDNGRKLLTPECNELVVALFAYVHDACRQDDGFDLEHGVRSAQWIETLRDNLLKSLTDDEFHMLQQACLLHTTEHMTGNPTIDACFDADRLDLWRVGITPDPDKLATEKGKQIARSTDYTSMLIPWKD